MDAIDDLLRSDKITNCLYVISSRPLLDLRRREFLFHEQLYRKSTPFARMEGDLLDLRLLRQ